MTFRGGLVAATMAVMLGCSDPAPPAPSIEGVAPASLRGTTWRVAAVNGQLPNRAAIPFISFEGDLVQGNGGCNSVFGQYTYDGAGGLDIMELGSTLILCEARVSEFEARLMSALDQASRALIVHDQLVLLGRGVVIVLDPTVGGHPGGGPASSA